MTSGCFNQSTFPDTTYLIQICLNGATTHFQGDVGTGDLHSMGKIMARTSGSSSSNMGPTGAFSGQAMVLGNLRDLCPENDKKDTPDVVSAGEDEEEEDEDEDDGITGPSPIKKGKPGKRDKKPKFWAADAAIAAAQRSFDNWLETTKHHIQQTIAEAEEALIAGNTLAIKERVKNECTILQSRLHALRIVLDGTPAALAEYIKEVERRQVERMQVGAAGSGSATSVGAARAKFGLAPPCSRYQELVTFSSLVPLKSMFHEATTKEHLIMTRDSTKESRNAIGELVNQVRVARKVVASCCAVALKQVEKTKLKTSTEKSKPSRKDKSAPPVSVVNKPNAWPIFELGFNIGRQVTSCRIEDFQMNKFYFNRPCTIAFPTTGEHALDIFNPASMVMKCLDSFRAKFQANALYSSAGRAQKPLPPDLQVACLEVFQRGLCHPADVVPSEVLPEKIQTSMKASVFGIARNTEHVSFEKDFLGTLRLGLVGTRTVVTAAVLDMVQLMEKRKVETPYSQDKLYEYFKNLNSDGLQYLAGEGMLWVCTVGAGDMLYIPPTMIVAERSSAQADFYGIRASYVFNVDEHREALADLNTHLASDALDVLLKHQPFVECVKARELARAVAKEKVPPAGTEALGDGAGDDPEDKEEAAAPAASGE